jgi:ABC-type phosphate transport system substrate-binding protein
MRWGLRVVLLVVVLLSAGEDVRPNEAGARPVPPSQNPPSEALAIVVNQSNPVQAMSSAELRDVFLGTRSHWPNGRRITIVMRDMEDPERLVILRDVCGMNEQQFRTHFVRGLYNGEILVSPKILSSVTGMRRFVFNVPGAIGYLRLSEVDSSVRALRIDERLPQEKGYRLWVPIQPVN